MSAKELEYKDVLVEEVRRARTVCWPGLATMCIVSVAI